MNNKLQLIRSNLRIARNIWGKLPDARLNELKSLTGKYCLRVALGDVLLLDEHWYITHAALLRLADRRRCTGIRVQQVRKFCDPAAGRWVFKAVIYKNTTSKGFVGYGDADPSNTSPLVRGAEMRVAETRAVNRALRKAYGIGLCSVEELGIHPFPVEPSINKANKNVVSPNDNGSSDRQSLRDRLCLLIRNYGLDPALVKRYAADFCGTETLREASRDLVESFVSTISKEAASDRAELVCKLNSYNQPEEVRS